MRRWSIVAAIGTMLLASACTSAGGETAAAHTTSPSSATTPSATASPTVEAQTAIPDGVYRTRPRTEQDLVALGLTQRQIDFAKNENELWTTTIVYELRIDGDQFVLTAASDGDDPIIADQGSLIVHGHTVDFVYYTDSQPSYTMRFWVSDEELRLKLLDNPCAEIDPDHCADFLVRAAYEALPFEAVS